jgi:dephospho-CoA kinase
MIKIGLCGSSGSGKGYACRLLEGYGVKWIDTDLLYRELVTKDSPCLCELVSYFGKEILKEDGSLDRSVLSTKVFEGEGSKARLDALNEISHRHIKEKTLALLEQYENEGCKAATIDAPVLFESGFDKLCDVTVCVTASYETKIQRITVRDGISREKAVARLNNQLSDSRLIELCTYSLDNSEGADIESQIAKLISDLGL